MASHRNDVIVDAFPQQDLISAGLCLGPGL